MNLVDLTKRLINLTALTVVLSFATDAHAVSPDKQNPVAIEPAATTTEDEQSEPGLESGTTIPETTADRIAESAKEIPPVIEKHAPGPEPENTAERCRDRRDNDGDNKLDCDDPDCAYMVFCAIPGLVLSKPPKLELSLRELHHIRRSLLAADILNFTGFISPLAALFAGSALAFNGNAAGIAGFTLLNIGISSSLAGSLLSSLAMTDWHKRFARAGYQTESGHMASSWVLSSLVIGASVAWWVLTGLAMNGNDSKGVYMGMIGLMIGTPIISTINNWLVRPIWKRKLLTRNNSQKNRRVRFGF